ncbi:MFS transporter [Streptomyces sp. NPDC026672]|uniref:MFS transporter n=1 Tax=unclassified Streptomyces TaxID=2593676 RepID=UPI0033F76238
MPTRSKKATRAAFLGFAVDYYDIYLPVVALAPAIQYFQPESISGSLETTLFYLTFAFTLIGRPIGSAIFGSLSDKIGRRKSTLIAVAGFTVATFLMAALPGYQAWGYGGLGTLMFLRLVGGVFMGGEYTSANPLALESCPKEKRGFVGALIASAYPIGYIAISLVTLPLLRLLPTQGLHSDYVQWGWRIPFVVGGLLGVVFFWYFHRSIEESQVWEEESKKAAPSEKPPLRQLFQGENGRRLLQVMLLMSGLWFAVQSIISPMSGLLIVYLKQGSDSVTTALLLANVALFLGYLAYGRLGQKHGRRKVLFLSGLGTAIVSAIAFYETVHILRSGGSFTLAMVVYTICLVVAIAPYGVATVYLLEAFPTRIRASGYGVAYSFSLVIPSFYSFYMLWLSNVMPYVYTPLVLIVLGGVLTALGAKLGPETKHVDFTPTQA